MFNVLITIKGTAVINSDRKAVINSERKAALLETADQLKAQVATLLKCH